MAQVQTKIILDQDSTPRRRAAQVIPGGMYGHLRAEALPAGYPQFFARGQGSRLWDVNGKEYIDFMCSWGPVVLGHRHPAIEAAAYRQMQQGDCLNGPTERMVELAERVVHLIAHADWVMFAKNGTDATTTCLTIARAATQRRKILVATGSYHGSLPWCTPNPLGVIAEDRAHIVQFKYNDIESLEAAANAAGNDLAGVLVSAFKHDYGIDQQLPSKAFAQCARAICDATGAALIVDDVRAGFRLHISGSWETMGVRPDLSAWSKAIANGYPLAAVTGNDRFRDAASRIFVTGSFWCGGVAMAAALATVEILEKTNAIDHMARMGQRLRDGLSEQAAAYGVAIRQTGPPQMPLILFEDDPDYKRGYCFTTEALQHGVYLHPKHNMFLSAAHTEADIDATLKATDAAFMAVASASNGCN